MDEAEARRRLAAARVARLATVRPDGRPDIVPCCFVVSEPGDRLFTAVDRKPKSTPRLQRLHNVRSNPHVTLLVDVYEEDWRRLWWVRARGVGRVLEDDDPDLARALALLVGKYEQYRRDPPTGPVLEVRIDEVRGWAASSG